MRYEHLSMTAQRTLMERYYWLWALQRAILFIALIEAAQATNERLEIVDCNAIPVAAFKESRHFPHNSNHVISKILPSEAATENTRPR